MIFKQVDEILSGRKTQTRRVCREGQILAEAPYKYVGENEEPVFMTPGIYICKNPDGSWHDFRLLYGIGRTYAVVPKRGQPAVWWKGKDWSGYGPEWRPMDLHKKPIWRPGQIRTREHLALDGWREMRIRITDIRKENVQNITEADAQSEGVASVEEYRELWQRINGRTKGARWDDNPSVWVLTFELAKEAQA